MVLAVRPGASCGYCAASAGGASVTDCPSPETPRMAYEPSTVPAATVAPVVASSASTRVDGPATNSACHSRLQSGAGTAPGALKTSAPVSGRTADNADGVPTYSNGACGAAVVEGALVAGDTVVRDAVPLPQAASEPTNTATGATR